MRGFARELPAKRRNILNSARAKQFPAFLQNLVQSFQHTQAKFPVTLDRHNTCVWQTIRCIRSKLNALLEVDQVELNLVGSVVQRQVGNQNVQQR